MAVINLNTGAVEKDQPDIAQGASNQPAINEQEKPSGIIDLKTGKFVSEQPTAGETARGQGGILESADRPTGIGDFFTGSERIAETPELGELPEFGTTPEGETFKIALGMLSTFNPKAQQDIIQEQVPEAVFEQTPDGSTIIEVPTPEGGVRRSVLNAPGFSAQDVTTAAAQVLSFLPSARAASFGKSVLQKVAIGSIGAGATEQALQETGVALGREERDPTETAIAAVTGGLAEAVVPAVQAFRGSRQAAKVGAARQEIDQVAGNVRAAQEASEQTGIPIFQAQQTVVPAQLERQAFVANLPAGTKSAVQGLTKQNKAAGDAVETFLSQIAPPESIVTGPEKFRTAAIASINKAKNIRSEKASPLYNQAFQEGAVVDLAPIRSNIIEKLDDLPDSGEISGSLKRVLKLIKEPKKGVNPSLKRLHNAKIEIDQMINKVGEGSVGNTTKAELRDVQSILLNQIDDASPAYKEARRVFSEASPPVVKAQDSIIGKIAELDDTQLKQIHAKIFDPAQTNPEITAQAKKAIKEIDPEAWDQMIRIELEKRLGSIKSIAEEGSVENVPGQFFRALFPNEKSNKALFNSLDGEAKKNLKYLQTSLKRASLGRPGGSQTAAREEIKRELRGGVFQSFRDLFRSPISTITSVGEDAMFDKRVRALSKALYDPTWKAEMKKIRKLSHKSPAAGRAFTQLINDIEATERPEQEQK